jgi:hypothetical protein
MKLKKTVTVKEDGRYLIYYELEPTEGADPAPGNSAAPEPSRPTTSNTSGQPETPPSGP